MIIFNWGLLTISWQNLANHISADYIIAKMASVTLLMLFLVIFMASTAHVEFQPLYTDGKTVENFNSKRSVPISTDDDPGLRIQTGKIVTEIPPFVVAIKSKAGAFGCTASLISPDRVLTAAHCKPKDPNQVSQVILGLLDVSRESVRANLDNPNVSIIDFVNEDFIKHPEYIKGVKPNKYNDIAIIKLKESVKPIFKPILLSSKDENFRDSLKSFGWGMPNCSLSSGHTSDDLREADGKYYDLRACFSRTDLEDVPQKVVCALFTVEGKPAGVAPGDSGGPLVSLTNPSKPVQIAIAKSVYKRKDDRPGEWCTNTSESQEFARISRFKQFILDNAPNAKFVE